MTTALRPRNTPGMSLRSLAARVHAAPVDGAEIPDVRINGVTLRAQDAAPGDLFPPQRKHTLWPCGKLP